MPVYYLETSVLVKKYRTEIGTDVIAELFTGKRQSEVFITSHLTVIEVASVATRLLRSRTLTRPTYEAILGSLSHDTSQTIQLQPISDDVVSDAIGLTQAHGLRAPDSIHLATALRARIINPGGNFYFLVSDAGLKTAARNSSLEVLDPEETNVRDSLRHYRP